MGKWPAAKLCCRNITPLAFVTVFFLLWVTNCLCLRETDSRNLLSYKYVHRAPRLPSKSRVATLAAKHFGQEKVGEILECSPGFRYSSQESLSGDENSPYYVQSVLKQYSQDHFKFGSPEECNVPISRTRVQHLLHQLFNRDGGTVQCPEVGDIYESIARAAPDNTIFCETGFNVGSSAAIFLHGSHGTASEVHSFDLTFPRGAVEFLNAIYSSQGKDRLQAHVGDMSETLQEFYNSGKLCDVIFLDAKHPEDLELTKMLARGSLTLFLYHWHFRSKDSKPFFTTSLNEHKTFTEISCVKTLCDLSHEDANNKIVRESCFGRLPGFENSLPMWWDQII